MIKRIKISEADRKKVKNIKIEKRIKRLFFFHGTAYTQKDGVALTYILKFKGGEKRELYMRVGQQIAEWKVPPDGFSNKNLPTDRLPDLPDARGTFTWSVKSGTKAWGLGVGGYIYSWENNVKEGGVSSEGGLQRGLAELESIDIVSSGKSVPMVFAITVELAE